MPGTTPPYNEQELLSRIAADNAQAFRQLTDHYAALVYGYLLRYVKDARLAEELSQDVFLKIWNNRKRLPGMENFPGYLYVALRNTAVNAFRSKLYEHPQPPADVLASQPSLRPEYKELAGALAEAIGQLPPRRKEIFLLSRSQDLTYEEIAARLGISKNTVREHIVEALVFLRAYIRQKFDIIVSIFFILQLIP